MQTKEDYSFGVVPVYKNGDEWQVLLVHQISYRGDSFWTLPKGHGEGTESPIETALRELTEETGLTDVTLDSLTTFAMEYEFVHQNEQIHKHVMFFLGQVHNPATVITIPKEIAELRWCTFPEAIEVATHTEIKRILQEAQEKILE